MLRLAEFNELFEFFELELADDEIGGFTSHYKKSTSFWGKLELAGNVPQFMAKRELTEDFFIIKTNSTLIFKRGDRIRKEPFSYEVEKLLKIKDSTQEIFVVRIYE